MTVTRCSSGPFENTSVPVAGRAAGRAGWAAAPRAPGRTRGRGAAPPAGSGGDGPPSRGFRRGGGAAAGRAKQAPRAWAGAAGPPRPGPPEARRAEAAQGRAAGRGGLDSRRVDPAGVEVVEPVALRRQRRQRRPLDLARVLVPLGRRRRRRRRVGPRGRRRRAARQRHQPQPEALGDAHLVARRDDRQLADGALVEEGAVRRLVGGDREGGAVAQELGVAARHGLVVDVQVALRVAADRDHRLVEGALGHLLAVAHDQLERRPAEEVARAPAAHRRVRGGRRRGLRLGPEQPGAGRARRARRRGGGGRGGGGRAGGPEGRLTVEDPADVERRRARRVAQLAVAGAQAGDHGGGGLRDVGRERAGVGDVLVDVARDDREEVVAVEGEGAGDAAEERDPQRVEVGPRVELLERHGLLGGHVVGRAQERADGDRAGLVQALGEAEVDQLGRPVVADQDVRGLQVAVDEVVLLEAGDRLGHAEAHRQGLRLGEPAVLAQQVLDRRAVDQLEGDVVLPGRGAAADVDERRHVGVPQGGRRLGLAQEALHLPRVAGEAVVEQLEGDDPVQVDLTRPGHPAHGALADRAQELERTHDLARGRIPLRSVRSALHRPPPRLPRRSFPL
ncbi:MAG: hypothetical protein M9894_01580 [Planctomycetes bacterium]|nr:hypothetical protein [Planctomycetota bacterium]